MTAEGRRPLLRSVRDRPAVAASLKPGCSARPCSRNGAVEEDGKWWCKQHVPSTVQRKRDERDEARAAQWGREQAALSAAVAKADQLSARFGVPVQARSRTFASKPWIVTGYDFVLPDEHLSVEPFQ